MRATRPAASRRRTWVVMVGWEQWSMSANSEIRAEPQSSMVPSSRAWAQRRLDDGFNFVTLGSDVGFLMRAVGEDLASVRKSGL